MFLAFMLVSALTVGAACAQTATGEN